MKQVETLGVLLAAGKSTRMGENKLLLPLEQQTIGTASLQNAIESDLDHTVVITKEDDQLDWIMPSIQTEEYHKNWSRVICHQANLGQSYSIRTGVEAATKLGAKSIMILLADQPFVPVKLLNDLIHSYKNIGQNQGVNFVAASFMGRIQPPILFLSTLFPQLAKLQGDQGARRILRNNKINGLVKQYDDWRCFYDIDTKDDYRWINEMG